MEIESRTLNVHHADLLSKLRSVMDEDAEEKVWHGFPEPRLKWIFTKPLAIFLICWCSIIGIFLWGVLSIGGEGAFYIKGFVILFLLPFMWFAWVIASSPFRAIKNYNATLYAVTNKRVIVILPNELYRIYPEHLKDIKTNNYEDGIANIYFFENPKHGKDEGRGKLMGFDFIRDSEGAIKAISELKR